MTKYLIPALAPVYAKAEPAVHILARVVAGIALMVHGWPKIQNPTGAAGMVESIGFVPGAFWSVLLSIGEFGGGLLLVLGLFTRPAAMVTAVIVAVTIYFHWVQLDQGYDGAEKSIIWLALLLWLMVKGAGSVSADKLIGRQI